LLIFPHRLTHFNYDLLNHALITLLVFSQSFTHLTTLSYPDFTSPQSNPIFKLALKLIITIQSFKVILLFIIGEVLGSSLILVWYLSQKMTLHFLMMIP